MKKIKVVFAEFQHETNIFCPVKAGRKEFEAFYFKEEISGGSIEISGTVKTIADGRFCNKWPVMKGFQNNIGRTVVLDSDGIEIIIPEWRMQPFDAEIFRRLGIEPSEKKILGLKSAVHFRASYGPMAKKISEVDTPEYGTMNFDSLKFENIKRPVYPLDKNFDYSV